MCSILFLTSNGIALDYPFDAILCALSFKSIVTFLFEQTIEQLTYWHRYKLSKSIPFETANYQTSSEILHFFVYMTPMCFFRFFLI